MNKNCTMFHVSHYDVQFLFFVIEQSLIFVITKSIKDVKSDIKQNVQCSTQEIGIELNMLETPEKEP